MRDLYSLLTHCIEIDEYDEDVKYIGVYETEEEAYEAINLVIDKPGFRDYPDGFHVSTLTPGGKLWRSGFFTGSGED